MKKQLQRLASLILVAVMVLSTMPFGVLAEEVPSQAVQSGGEISFNDTTEEGQGEFTGQTDSGLTVSMPEDPSESISEDNPELEQPVSSMEDKLTVQSAPIVSLKADKNSPQNRNSSVKFTATVSGGTAPYAYVFSCVNDDTAEAISFDPPATSAPNAISINFKDAGTYTIKVIVQDANEEVAEITFPYEIRNNPIVDLSVSPDVSTIHYAKDPLTLTATMNGGKEPLSYRFYYSLGTQKVEIKNPTTNGNEATVAFTPSVAGTYSFSVESIDAKGLRTTASITNFQVLSAVTVKSFTTDKPSGQNVKTAIKLTASGSGGVAPYTYVFYYYQDDSVEKVFIEEDKLPETDTVIFEPAEIGTYKLCVDIRDNNGDSEKLATKTIGNYKIISGPVLDDFTALNKSGADTPTYVGDPIELKAALETGTGTAPVKYTFTIKNGSKTLKTIAQSDSLCEFIPTTPGTYNFTVTVTDANGRRDTRMASLPVYNTVGVTLKPSKPSPQSIYTEITLTANGTGGQAPYTYEFEYDYDGETKILQYGSQSNTAAFAVDDPDKVGSYTFRVKVTDANGIPSKPVEVEAYQIINPPVIEDLIADPVKGSTVYQGVSITLEAVVADDTGEGPLKYTFYVNGNKETDSLDTNTYEYTPQKGGSYTFEVAVDDGVTIVRKKISGYNVIAGVSVTSLNANKKVGLIKDDTIQLSAMGSGGVGPYSYQFSYEIKDAEGNTVEKGDITTAENKLKTIDYQLKTAGTYTFMVKIIDKNEEFSQNDAEKALTIEVTDPPKIKNLEINYPGKDTKLTSSAQGKAIELLAIPEDESADLTYTFSYKVGSKTTPIDNADGDNKTSFTPTVAGSYTFYVSAKDKDSGLPGPIFTLNKFTVFKALTVKSFKTSKPSGQNINTEIKLTATPDGGAKPYTYAFYQKRKTSDADTITEAEYDTCKITSDDSTKNFISVKPEQAGTYIFKVVITDDNKETASQSIDFVVDNPPVVTLTHDKTTTPVYLGNTVKLTAKVESGTGVGDLDYTFYWKLGAETEYLPVATEGDHTASVDFIPEKAGTYTLYVDVIDDNHVQKTATVKSLQVYDVLKVDSLVIDQVSPQNIGTTIKLTANGSGGKTAYKYQFYYKLDYADATKTDISEWTPYGLKSAAKTISFPLKYAGTYQFHVIITDGNNTVTGEADAGSISEEFVAVNKPIINRFVASPTAKQYVEEPITLTATARGGSGDYKYEFSYEDSSGVVTPITETTDDTPGTITFDAITEPGSYLLHLKVTDNKNADAESNWAEKTLTYTLVDTPSVKTFTIGGKSTIKKGESITLKATGQDGIGAYQYQFLMEKGGVTKVIRAFSSNASYLYTPTEAGDYTFYVKIKDSKMTAEDVSELTQTLEVTTE